MVQTDFFFKCEVKIFNNYNEVLKFTKKQRQLSIPLRTNLEKGFFLFWFNILFTIHFFVI